jgi:ClpP class serine protease
VGAGDDAVKQRTARADARPERRAFRAAAVHGEALALDPGAGGLIASVLRGAQPSPQAFGFYYDPPSRLRFDPESVEDGVAVLCVSGPLEHHDTGWCHSYETIVRETRVAMTSGDVRAGALRIDSPGGVAAGMGETHRAIRAIMRETGKPIYAFANEMAASAAYSLASACREVWTTPAGHIGSVGVILCTVDESAALDKMGVKIRYLVTGARKADMHPGAPLTEEAIDVAQAKVDKLGGQFFRSVAHARGKAPGGAKLATPDAVKALQAGVFVGDDAVRVGLADGIASWAKFLGYVKAAAGAPRAT